MNQYLVSLQFISECKERMLLICTLFDYIRVGGDGRVLVEKLIPKMGITKMNYSKLHLILRRGTMYIVWLLEVRSVVSAPYIVKVR